MIVFLFAIMLSHLSVLLRSLKSVASPLLWIPSWWLWACWQLAKGPSVSSHPSRGINHHTQDRYVDRLLASTASHWIMSRASVTWSKNSIRSSNTEVNKLHSHLSFEYKATLCTARVERHSCRWETTCMLPPRWQHDETCVSPRRVQFLFVRCRGSITGSCCWVYYTAAARLARCILTLLFLFSAK